MKFGQTIGLCNAIYAPLPLPLVVLFSHAGESLGL